VFERPQLRETRAEGALSCWEFEDKVWEDEISGPHIWLVFFNGPSSPTTSNFHFGWHTSLYDWQCRLLHGCPLPSPSLPKCQCHQLKLSLPSKLLFIGFFYLEFLLCCVCAIHVLSCSVTLPSPPGSFHVSLCIHSFICSFIHSFIQHATNTHETQT
jgi:hypothetical protein